MKGKAFFYKLVFFLVVLGFTIMPVANAEELDIFGYFEPQFIILYREGGSYQMNSDKLRVDLQSSVSGVGFGANLIYTLYYGKRNWNILDFFSDDIRSEVPPSMQSYFLVEFNDTLYLDNAYVRMSNSKIACTFGKQQISLGTGYFSNPVDVFNLKDALDPTYEQTGHNGARLDIMLQDRTSVMLLYSPIEGDWKNSGKLLRLKMGLGHFDFILTGYEFQDKLTDFYSVSVTNERRRLTGFEFVGELLGLGVWGEGAYNFMETSDDFYEFLLGSDYTFESGFYVLLEYHRNERGKARYEDYDINDWLRFYLGENKTICLDQIYAMISYPVTDLINLQLLSIFSANDGSAAVVPVIDYNIFENMDLNIMGNVFTGGEGKAYNSKLGNGLVVRARAYF
jgi:hypothetical protein